MAAARLYSSFHQSTAHKAVPSHNGLHNPAGVLIFAPTNGAGHQRVYTNWLLQSDTNELGWRVGCEQPKQFRRLYIPTTEVDGNMLKHDNG